MVHVIPIPDDQDPFEMIERMRVEANQYLHPRQTALTFGDHWANFMALNHGIVEFGHVTPADQIEPEALADVTRDQERGYLFGRAHSQWEPDGELGDTHKLHAWPITEGLFEAAREVEWNHTLLAIEHRMALDSVYAEFRSHILTTPYGAGVMSAVVMSQAQLLDVLDDIRAHVADGDSLEGFLEYLLPDLESGDPPEGFRVRARYRTGNRDHGQGFMRIYEDLP